MQFEVLAKLDDLWKTRIDGCPDAAILEYVSTVEGVKGLEHNFKLVFGSLDMPAGDKDRSFYEYILVRDEGEDDQEIPVESLFDDLGVSGFVFPLNKFTKSKWGEQHSRIQREVLITDLRDISTDGKVTRVVAQTWGGLTPGSVKLVAGTHYRISNRLIDFNISKVLSTLIELDFQSMVSDASQIPFLQLILDPKSFGRDKIAAESQAQTKRGNNIQRLFQELKGLDVDSAGGLVLKKSQNYAAQRILSNRLSVVWGPPGKLE